MSVTQSITHTLPDFLTPDCTACSGLCCVVLPFDAAQGFGFDKAAHTPCPHLQGDFRCEIHNQLSDRGFKGCVQYNCFGAGQATMKLLASKPWTQSQEHAEHMFDVFTRLRPLHELLSTLTLALSYCEVGEVHDALRSAYDKVLAACASENSVIDTRLTTRARQSARTALKDFSASPEGIRLKAAQSAPGP